MQHTIHIPICIYDVILLNIAFIHTDQLGDSDLIAFSTVKANSNQPQRIFWTQCTYIL